MALVNRSFQLDITPGAIPTVVNASEYDQNRQYTVNLIDKGGVFEIPSGTTATVEGTIGGSGFSANATISGNTITFTLSESMTAKAGDVWCKIKLTKDSKPIQSCAFILRCDRAGVEADAVIGAPGFEEQIRDAAEDWLEDQGFSSPTIGVTEIEGGHRVTVTDYQGAESFDVMDGEDTGVEVDTTLSVEGKAADAKAVGDALNNYETEEYATASNLYNPDTMFKDASVISTSGIYIGGYAGRALALIPVTSGKYYAIQAKSLAWTNGRGIAFTDSSNTMLYGAQIGGKINSSGFCQLSTPVLMTATSNVSVNENVVVTSDTTLNGLCVKAPTGAAYMAVEIVYQSQDSRTSFMVEEGRTCHSYSAPSSGGAESIVQLFGKGIADKFLRDNAVIRDNIGVYGGGGNIFDISTMMIGGATVSSGSLTPSTTGVYAKIPVIGGKTYSLSKRGGAWVSKGAVLLLDQNGDQIYRVVVQTETTNGDYTYPATLQIVAATGRSGGDIQASADGTSRGLTITVSNDTAFLALNHSLNTPYTDALMVNEGGNCLNYAPYGGGTLEGALIESLCGAKFVDSELREQIGGGSSGKKYEGVVWTALGDSITVGGGGGGGYYADKVKNDLGFTLVNAAHSGVPFSAGTTQSEQIPTGCRICTVALGTNNSLETDASIGQIGDQTSSTLHGQIYLLMNKILTEHPNIILGFIAPVPRYDSDATHNRQESVRKVAKAIVEACAYYCIPCLDLQTTIGFHPAVKSVYYTADNLHPSALGSQRMALAIEQWMSSLLG